MSCDPFNPDPLSKQSLLSSCKQYLNYVDNYGKEHSSGNLLVPKENLPYGDVLVLTECRLYDGVSLDPDFRLHRCLS